EFRSFKLHPSLLDGALQTVLGLLKPGDDSQAYVPFALGEIEQYQPLTQTVYAHAALSEDDQADGSRKFDISIAGENGAVLLSIRDFAVKPLHNGITRKASEPFECLLYYPTWEERPITRIATAAPAGDRPEPVLIFDGVETIAQQLAHEAIRPILVQ